MYRYTISMSVFSRFIYQGSAFTVEWYTDDRGRSAAFHYFESLSIERRVRFLKLVRIMAEAGKIFDTTKFRNEGEQIYAFKPQPDRFLCFFFHGRRIIVTNGFEKKSDKLPPGEKDRALRAKADFELRFKQGAYYEKK